MVAVVLTVVVVVVVGIYIVVLMVAMVVVMVKVVGVVVVRAPQVWFGLGGASTIGSKLAVTGSLYCRRIHTCVTWLTWRNGRRC